MDFNLGYANLLARKAMENIKLLPAKSNHFLKWIHSILQLHHDLPSFIFSRHTGKFQTDNIGFFRRQQFPALDGSCFARRMQDQIIAAAARAFTDQDESIFFKPLGKNPHLL
jgi:hypothetical protein